MFTNRMYSQRVLTFFVGQAFLPVPLFSKLDRQDVCPTTLYASTAVKLNLDSNAIESLDWPYLKTEYWKAVLAPP